MNFNHIQQLKEQNPLVHNITNIVVANYVANGLLSIGASPIMSNTPEEMDEIVSISQALVINIGTLNEEQIDAMILAGQSANKHNIPVVLDPVGVGATKYRQEVVKKLISKINFTAIRGNAGEIATLGEVSWNAKGVDAGNGEGDLSQIAKIVAKKYDCIVAISGEIDYISDGKRVAKIENGTPLFPKITGSGCLLGAIIGAFLSLDDDNFTLCVSACASYAIAGELAAKNLKDYQIGQFFVSLLDNLALLDDELAKKYAKISYE